MKRRLAYAIARGGFVYVAIVLLLLLAVAWRPTNLLIWAIAVSVAMVIVSGVTSGWMMMAIVVRRLHPRDAHVGQPLVLRYEVRNTSWLWPAFAVSIRESALPKCAAWLVSLGPGESCIVELVAWPTRRGVIRLSAVRAESAFPFGLLTKRASWVQRASVTVVPRVHTIAAPTLRGLIERGRAGQRAMSRAGLGEEFYGVREAGEFVNLRDVAWRRTAGREQLAVVERSSPSFPRVRCILNVGEPTAALAKRLPKDVVARDREEDAITMVASLVASAIGLGYEVSVRVHGLPCPALPASGGVRHLDRLLVQLAQLDLDAPRDAAFVSGPGDELACSLVVHPGRIDTSLGGPAAQHQSAAQLAAMIERVHP